jgi:uncharacterized iron-regulated membrane protein
MTISTKTMRRWAWIHKWSSLICTPFILLLCLTGLPLIFHHEILHLTGAEVEAPSMEDSAKASFDEIVDSAQGKHPDLFVQFLFQEPDEQNLWTVGLNKDLAAVEGGKTVIVDARTAEVLNQPNYEEGFLYVMFKLHVDLFLGLPGKLFLGLMGMLLIAAIISGVVLYAPFMRKLNFGDVRRNRNARLQWLDLHNLLGIVTLTWVLVVGGTGVLNTWADLLFKYWQFDQVSQMIAPYKGVPAPDAGQLGSLEKSVQAAVLREPDMKPGFIAFPGTILSSAHHYAVFMRGDTPLTTRLFRPVLIDAVTEEFTDSRQPPWYITALLLSQPLHFGDYAGMPMKILWALLDIATMLVLGSGLYLWWKRRRKPIEELLDTAITEGVVK